MKAIILTGALCFAALGVAETILTHPELLPPEVVAAFPELPMNALDDQDLADLNRIAKVQFKAWEPATQAAVIKTARPLVFPAPAKPPQAQTQQLAQADVPPPATLPEPPESPEPPAAPTPPAAAGPLKIERQLETIKRQADQIRRDAQQLSQRAYSWAATPLRFGSWAPERQSLVIRFSDTDPKSIAAAREDLNVMRRILVKSASKESGDEEERKAMGIFVSSAGDGVRNLQIEGQGVIFLLKANFPLSGPAATEEPEKPKEPSNLTWEEAKRELYGSRDAGGKGAGAGTGTKVEYDPKRVEDLKDSLLDALKNAGNIRSLKDGETVTVVVTSGDLSWNYATSYSLDSLPHLFGSSASASSSTSHSTRVEVHSSSNDDDAGRPSGSTLTLRVKKADIDAFAKGKINHDEFRKRATIALY